MLRQLLTYSGALVTTVPSGEAALVVLESVLADVIISDRRCHDTTAAG
jgi:CheY-like chemotaxis protein